MGNVPAISASLGNYTEAIQHQAIRNKQFAQELVFHYGLEGEITDSFVQGIVSTKTHEFFDPNGRITKFGQQEIRRVTQGLGLNPNASVAEIIEAKCEKTIMQKLGKLKKLPLLKNVVKTMK